MNQTCLKILAWAAEKAGRARNRLEHTPDDLKPEMLMITEAEVEACLDLMGAVCRGEFNDYVAISCDNAPPVRILRPIGPMAYTTDPAPLFDKTKYNVEFPQGGPEVEGGHIRITPRNDTEGLPNE